MTTYLQPKEDKVLILPHTPVLLNLNTDQTWIPLKKFKSSKEVIGYAMKLENDTSASAYLLDLDVITSNFDVISEGEILNPMQVKRALDALIDES